MIKNLENRIHDKRLKELESFSPEKKYMKSFSETSLSNINLFKQGHDLN